MSGILWAIDPGPTSSGWVQLDVETGLPLRFSNSEDNYNLLTLLEVASRPEDHLAIEWIESFGMRVGESIFETVFWSGRFCQAFAGSFSKVTRRLIKSHLCNTNMCKDKHVRSSLIYKFGGDSTAIGTKANPGPLRGIASHGWSALAVAVTFHEAIQSSREASNVD